MSVGRTRKVYSLLGERGRFTVCWANEEGLQSVGRTRKKKIDPST